MRAMTWSPELFSHSKCLLTLQDCRRVKFVDQTLNASRNLPTKNWFFHGAQMPSNIADIDLFVIGEICNYFIDWLSK